MLFTHFVLIPLGCAMMASLAAAPLGCLMAWRRLVYFGEALSHASLLGISLALFFNLPLTLGIWLVTLLMIALLYGLKKQDKENPSNILGSLSHLALALGLIFISRMEHIRTDLMSYLFGDMLATTGRDLVMITIVVVLTLLALYKLWNHLILMTLNPDVASTENPKTHLIDLGFLLILGSFIATMVQYFGLLFVIALLIIPANTANRLAKTPEQSALFSAIIAIGSAAVGTALAWQAALPLAPAIIAITGMLYFAAVVYNFYQAKAAR
ncbi:MAG: metal ABC transporter permease [Cardiobacteriaceae bacterium]|nr:metal ABC transporter permease [Cardiobacteriaceae bacterium]